MTLSIVQLFIVQMARPEIAPCLTKQSVHEVRTDESNCTRHEYLHLGTLVLVNLILWIQYRDVNAVL